MTLTSNPPARVSQSFRGTGTSFLRCLGSAAKNDCDLIHLKALVGAQADDLLIGRSERFERLNELRLLGAADDHGLGSGVRLAGLSVELRPQGR